MSTDEQESAARAEVERKLQSQSWRLSNLYWVEDENGKKVKFRPRWEQRELHNNLHTQNAVLKCRQPGISTYCALLMLDFALFTPNKTCGIIDKTDPDAVKKLDKIGFAYAHLDDPDDPTTAGIGSLIKATRWLVTDNDHEFAISNGSKIWAGTGMRGGTLQFLWITELGYTSFYNPKDAEEIKKGALNTIHAGNRIIVESTHEGGKFGVFYNILKLAMEAKEPLSPMDWRFHFFAWWRHKGYTMEPPPGWLPDAEHAAYFTSLVEKGIALTPGQMHWYVKKHAAIGDAIMSEFPSTEDEAFEAVIKGAIYGKHITQLRAKKRIVDFQHDRTAPLYAFWGHRILGLHGNLASSILREGHLRAGLPMSCGQDPAYYVAIIREWERFYERPVVTNYLPHDAANKGFGGKSAQGELRGCGLTNTVIVHRTPDVWIGIRHLRSLLPRFVFHKTNCGQTWVKDGTEMPSGIGCLEGYHTKEDASSGILREMPVHDATSHGSDALRTFAEAEQGGMLPGSTLIENAGPARVILAGYNRPRSQSLGPSRIIIN